MQPISPTAFAPPSGPLNQTVAVSTKRRWPLLAAIGILFTALLATVFVWRAETNRADDNAAVVAQQLIDLREADSDAKALLVKLTASNKELTDEQAANKAANIALTAAKEERDAALQRVEERILPLSQAELRGSATILLDIWTGIGEQMVWTRAELTSMESAVNDQLVSLAIGGANYGDTECVTTLALAFGDLKSYTVAMYPDPGEVTAPQNLLDLLAQVHLLVVEAVGDSCGVAPAAT